jgi:imidazolonepropionase
MPVLRNIGTLATCKPGPTQSHIHAIQNAALAWEGERITWVGPEGMLPASYQDEEMWDAYGSLVIPGLVDCHTHLAFGGWRADEFEQRIQGKNYRQIARSGGGILNTVHHTREASRDNLIEKAGAFLADMGALGITTVECKSGYGLNAVHEFKQLRVYEALRRRQPLRVVSTFLAHTIPTVYLHDREAYVDMVCDGMIPQIAAQNLASFCDVFVEDTAFRLDEARALLKQGKKHGLRLKVHADQLSDGGGAKLAAELGAISAEHLEYVSDESIALLAEAGVVAVSLPLATLYLNQPPLPARKLIEAGVPVAVATDFNPGSAPSYHLPLAMLLACTMQRMTPTEVLMGATYIAAQALGLEQEIGSLEPGKSADFVLIDASSVNNWISHFRPNAAFQTVIKGHVL